MNDWMLVAGWLGGVVLLAALSWKWCLPARAAAPIVTLAAACGALAVAGARAGHWPWLPALALVGGAELAVYVGAILYRFYRDPERTPPSDPRAIVSPADGTVIYVRRVPAGGVLRSEKRGAQLVLEELQGSRLAAQELWQIGISMVFTDVHVNRAPIAGKVTMARHQPGRFLSLRLPEAVNLNERQTLVLDNGRFALALVQIASRLVRRIEAYVREGQTVERGQRIGMIKFGSQVDVFLPVEVAPELRVREGDALVAGESVLALSPALSASAQQSSVASPAVS